jgi:hypothetical protein
MPSLDGPSHGLEAFSDDQVSIRKEHHANKKPFASTDDGTAALPTTGPQRLFCHSELSPRLMPGVTLPRARSTTGVPASTKQLNAVMYRRARIGGGSI